VSPFRKTESQPKKRAVEIPFSMSLPKKISKRRLTLGRHFYDLPGLMNKEDQLPAQR
jgi:hypothetical protein